MSITTALIRFDDKLVRKVYWYVVFTYEMINFKRQFILIFRFRLLTYKDIYEELVFILLFHSHSKEEDVF